MHIFRSNFYLFQIEGVWRDSEGVCGCVLLLRTSPAGFSEDRERGAGERSARRYASRRYASSVFTCCNGIRVTLIMQIRFYCGFLGFCAHALVGIGNFFRGQILVFIQFLSNLRRNLSSGAVLLLGS